MDSDGGAIINREGISNLLRERIPALLGIYAFGSQLDGTAGGRSDLDLAVLVAGYADPRQLWEVSAELADLTGLQVDLLDLRAASTVMQHQVITSGEQLWALDSQAGLYETFILSEKLAFDESRRELLEDIRKRGTIYG